MKPSLIFPVGKTRKRRGFSVLRSGLAALTALILLLLSACAVPSAARTSRPSVRRAPEQAYSVHADTESGVAKAEGGAVVATYRYQLPVMVPLRTDGSSITAADVKSEREKQALAVAETFNAEFVQWAEEADFPSLEEAAREDYQWRVHSVNGWDMEYAQSLETTIYQTDRLVSVAGNFYSYSGGAHPNTMLFGWNFDLDSGKFFSPEQLFEDVEAVTRELVRMAGERAAEYDLPPEEFFWRDYADVLAVWSDSNVAVTFDEKDMTVSYPPYELASYAAGEQIFTIPLAWLEPWMNSYGKSLLFGT